MQVGTDFNKALTVLLVDDDKALAGFVKKGLEDEGYAVMACFDGDTALRQAEHLHLDLILLDVMLPGLDGFEITRRLRATGNRTPIVLLTGRDATEDVIKGLDAGADDYLTKPFVFDVLIARIRARTRAGDAKNAAELRFAGLLLDSVRITAVRDGHHLDLTRTEFVILECLMRSAGRVVRRSHLIDMVWGDRHVTENNLDVFMRFLRNKVDRRGLPRLLHTERGVGYCLRQERR